MDGSRVSYWEDLSALTKPRSATLLKGEAQALLLYVFGCSVISFLILFFLLKVHLPSEKSKMEVMRRDLRTLCEAVLAYQDSNNQLPESLAQLQTFTGEDLCLVDPWRQHYIYRKVPDGSAIVASGGQNRSIDVSDEIFLDVSGATLKDSEAGKIFQLVGWETGLTYDDTIYVVTP